VSKDTRLAAAAHIRALAHQEEPRSFWNLTVYGDGTSAGAI